MKLPISLVIVTTARPSLYPCLASVARLTPGPAEVILVVNGAKLNRRTLPRLLGLRILTIPRNIGAAAGRNRGARASRQPLLFFLDDDVEVAPDILVKLAPPLEKQQVGAASPIILASWDRSLILGLGHDVSLWTGRVSGLAIGERDLGQFREEVEVPMLGATALLLRRRLFEELAGFDEHFDIPYEDSDLSLRIRARGLKLLCLPEAKVWHASRPDVSAPPLLRFLGITSEKKAERALRNKILLVRRHASPLARSIFFSLVPLYLGLYTAAFIASGRSSLLRPLLRGTVTALAL